MSVMQILWLFGLCFLAALLALLVAALVQRRFERGRIGLAADAHAGAVLLFDGEVLLDATAAARGMLAATRSGGSDWQRFLAWAGPRFPGVEQQLAALAELGRVSIVSPLAEGLTLLAEWRSGVRRITLLESHVESHSPLIDSLSHQAQLAELAELQAVTDAGPLPIWREDAAGEVIWGNPAYAALTTAVLPGTSAMAWPLPRVLDVGESGRVELTAGGGQRWFDCHVAVLPEGRVIHALPADAAVQAEQALGSFVQTLTKTFAHLPIGLAIFDRQRRLQLFNPALSELTALSPEFLSARPALFNLLDAMRESGMIPEPRDYKAWRAQLAAIERSAAGGLYEETWALPSGRTWQVTGRPHPQGALALLLQDISDEVTRTRRMRADLELGQSVIDATDEAIAVFSSAGALVMSNTAYARLWGQDPSAMAAEHCLAAMAESWRAACAPSGFWAQALSYVALSGLRNRLTMPARLNDGRMLACRLAPLAGGATLVGFALEAGASSAGMQLIELPEAAPFAAPVRSRRAARSGA